MGYIIVFILTVIIYTIAVKVYYHKAQNELNDFLKNKNEYNTELEKLKSNCKEIKQDKDNLEKHINSLLIQKTEITNSLSELEKQAREAGEKFFAQQQELAETRLEAAITQLGQKYQQYEQECQEEYATLMADLSQASAAAIDQQMLLAQDLAAQIEVKKLEIAEQQSIAEAVVAVNKRTQEEIAQKDFYRLQITEKDIQEIEKLKEIIPYLRDPEALNKVIWKVYYEKPYTDLVGRVIGSGIHTGIYKITNLKNGMCYVGQAASLSDRWKQHIKRGIGAEAPTHNKLYPAMMEFGVENFTFEVIEECERNKLNDREDYYQEFFKAKEFGYSIK